jgi:peptidoglycan biosynthesis protein MviN/MurJ (putative lipid II flippase)
MENLKEKELKVLIATAIIATLLYAVCVPGMGLLEIIAGVVFIFSCTLAVFYCMRKQEMKTWWNSRSSKFRTCSVLGGIIAIMFLIMGADSLFGQFIWAIALCMTIGLAFSILAYVVSFFIPKKIWEKFEKETLDDPELD